MVRNLPEVPGSRLHSPVRRGTMVASFDFDKIIEQNMKYMKRISAERNSQSIYNAQQMADGTSRIVSARRGKFKQNEIATAMHHGISKDIYTIDQKDLE